MLKLEVFETAGPEMGAAYLDPQSAEKLRDSAFEQGYGAGWQDALEQMRDDTALRRAATFEALQALTFTYAEARAMCDSQLAGIIEDLLTKIVPQIGMASLPGRVAQEIAVLLARDATAPLQVLCSPESLPHLQEVLADLPQGARITLVGEPSYTAAQVTIQGQAQRRQIDLSPLGDLIRADFAPEAKPTPTPVASMPNKGTHHG